MEMNYIKALDVLETLRRGSRPVTSHVATEALSEIPNDGGQPSVKGKPAISGMDKWLESLGYSLDDINALNVIHIAGTKGKGSTCAYIECLLRQHGQRTGYPTKTGLYTSPHLKDVEERIRINFEPLSKEKFAEYASYVANNALNTSNDAPKYLQFLALVSFHAFVKEGVDVAIYETHQGGEFDSTNIISGPKVTAVTSLDRDHMQQLGPTLQQVAWHKAGIFKHNAAAFSVPQEPTLASVLQDRARTKGADLKFVDAGGSGGGSRHVPRDGPKPESGVQEVNFSLACAVSNEFLRQKGRELLSSHDKQQALEKCSWPGRFQQILDGNVTWFLDGAHNELSLKVCTEWFARKSAGMEHGGDSTTSTSSSVNRVLVFGHFSTHRDGVNLVKTLAEGLSRHRVSIQRVLFVPYEYKRNTNIDIQFELLQQYTKCWNEEYRQSNASEVHILPTLFSALDTTATSSTTAKGTAGNTHVLVTGSLHLVGGALDFLATRQ